MRLETFNSKSSYSVYKSLKFVLLAGEISTEEEYYSNQTSPAWRVSEHF